MNIMAGATMLGLVKSSIGTKFTSQFGNLIAVSSLLLCLRYCYGVLLSTRPCKIGLMKIYLTFMFRFLPCCIPTML